MFDLGFSELIVIAVVALIVIGPERLPRVARTAGHLLGRLQRYVSDVKADIQREMQIEDLKKLQEQIHQQARDLEQSMRSQLSTTKAELDDTAREASAALSEPRAAQPAPVGEATPSPVVPPADSAGAPATVAEAAAPDGAPAEPSPQLELGLDPANRRPVEKA